MKFEVEDIFFMSIRWTLTIFLFYKVGLLYTILICTFINYSFKFLMWKIFKLQALNPIDELFLQDDEKNRSNIVSKILSKVYCDE